MKIVYKYIHYKIINSKYNVTKGVFGQTLVVQIRHLYSLHVKLRH